MTFFSAIEESVKKKGGPLCVGIDPRIEPDENSFSLLKDYGQRVVDDCLPYAVAFKPQLAFFELHGSAGWEALESILQYIHTQEPNCPVILDAKRGDIASTAEAYARNLLQRPGSIAVTLSPYLGKESIEPFLRYEEAGIFLLCRTTNLGAERIQMKVLQNGEPLYLAIADEVLSWESNPANSRIGLVVAGNNSHALQSVREQCPDTWFLAPGIGAQGGKPDEALRSGARADGLGVLASASRSVTESKNPAMTARKLRDELNDARESLPARGEAYTFRGLGGSKKDPPELTPDERRELLEGFFHIGAFKVGKFKLKSGQKSSFYIDLRRLSGNPRLLALSGRAYASVLKDMQYDHIAALPVAALPLGTATALTVKSSLIYPRLAQKEHGSGVQVEGSWLPGETAILLDDLITTGGSKLEAAAILRKAGLRVNNLVVLIERSVQGREDLQAIGISLKSWTNLKELVQVGLDAGFVDSATATKIGCGEL